MNLATPSFIELSSFSPTLTPKGGMSNGHKVALVILIGLAAIGTAFLISKSYSFISLQILKAKQNESKRNQGSN